MLIFKGEPVTVIQDISSRQYYVIYTWRVLACQEKEPTFREVKRLVEEYYESQRCKAEKETY